MCNFESSQEDKSRAQSADSSKAYSNPSLQILVVSLQRQVQCKTRSAHHAG